MKPAIFGPLAILTAGIFRCRNLVLDSVKSWTNIAQRKNLIFFKLGIDFIENLRYNVELYENENEQEV